MDLCLLCCPSLVCDDDDENDLVQERGMNYRHRWIYIRNHVNDIMMELAILHSSLTFYIYPFPRGATAKSPRSSQLTANQIPPFPPALSEGSDDLISAHQRLL